MALSLYLLLAMKTPRKQQNREQGEDVHVLHAEGHVEDADVEALLEGDLEGSPHR